MERYTISVKTNLEEYKRLLKVLDEKVEELNEKTNEVSIVIEQLNNFQLTIEINN